MKRLTWLLLALLAVAPVSAKPKVDVRIKVNEGISKERVGDKLSMGRSGPGDTFTTTVWYLNVTIASNNVEAVAKNNGQWCISGDSALDINGEYQGTLDGNSLAVQVPAKNEKINKLRFEVFDHKWRELSKLD